jgi:heterotetrameric sarcosine oxidase gamma subunit
VANLIAKSAFDGLLPLTIGDLALVETTFEAITWIAPLKGKATAVSKALTKQVGAAFPEPGQVTGTTTRAVWSGPGQAMILGAAVKPIKGAALSAQSGAWASCSLSGADAAEVLARLVPIDLRDTGLAVGHCARTLLGHMNCILIRSGTDQYEVMVFRSMAATATHELDGAMRAVAARKKASA